MYVYIYIYIYVWSCRLYIRSSRAGRSLCASLSFLTRVPVDWSLPSNSAQRLFFAGSFEILYRACRAHSQNPLQEKRIERSVNFYDHRASCFAWLGFVALIEGQHAAIVCLHSISQLSNQNLQQQSSPPRWPPRRTVDLGVHGEARAAGETCLLLQAKVETVASTPPPSRAAIKLLADCAVASTRAFRGNCFNKVLQS